MDRTTVGLNQRVAQLTFCLSLSLLLLSQLLFSPALGAGEFHFAAEHPGKLTIEVEKLTGEQTRHLSRSEASAYLGSLRSLVKLLSAQPSLPPPPGFTAARLHRQGVPALRRQYRGQVRPLPPPRRAAAGHPQVHVQHP